MDYELILRSDENHSIMIKSFWYLWMIVLIFPTFGFTTGMAVLENVFSKNHTEPVFRCSSSRRFAHLLLTIQISGGIVSFCPTLGLSS